MALINSRVLQTISVLIVVCFSCIVQSAFAGSIVSWGSVIFDSAELGGNDFVAVAAGGYHSLALKSDGSIVGWGYNSSGQASPPDGNDFIAVVAGIYHSLALKSDGSIVGWGSEGSVPEGKDFESIATCKWHSLALRSDGSIVGWGKDTSGQATPPDGNDFVAIAAGGDFSLALKSDGSIVGWGDNYAGQATPPDGNDFVAIAAGYNHSLALKSDGSIVSWGRDNFGQATPPDGNDFVAVAAQYLHSVALKSDGSIVRWGANYYGQAIPPEGNDFIAIAAGAEHGLALKSDGSIVGWGTDHLAQAKPPKGTDFVTIATGGYTMCSSMIGCEHLEHSLALKSDGSIVGWGRNSHGQATPPDGNDFIATVAGGAHSLALKSDGSIVGWGDNEYDQATPPEGNDFVAIAAGNYHSLALKYDGSVVGWGLNDDAQATSPDSNDFVAIVAGGNHSLALKSDGSLVGWGSNDVWVFGWSDELEEYYCGQATPPDGNDYVAIASAGGHRVPGRQWGGGHNLALKSDGSIVAWGCGGPGQPPEDNDFMAIAAGPERDLALKSDGSIVAWGEEYTTGQATPPEGKDFVAIAAGGDFSLAIRNTSGKYSGGTGEPNDPYQIATAEDLILLGATPEDYDKHFILTANIDLDPNLPGRKVFDRAVIAPDTNDADWAEFNGISFTGAFDGNNHTILHLTITGGSFLALFGHLGYEATISNLGLEAIDVNATGDYVGGLVGSVGYERLRGNINGSVTNCYSTGMVSGNENVGGLVGRNSHGSIITNCYSTSTVIGSECVGGLVGYNYRGGSIATSYSNGTVSGDRHVGGLVGRNQEGRMMVAGPGRITLSYSTSAATGIEYVGGLVGSNGGTLANSYSSGSVTGNDHVGGLVGFNDWIDDDELPGTVVNCYSTGAVSGNSGTGGLVGSNEGTVIASFWDTQTSGQSTSAGGIGLISAEMRDLQTYENAGWGVHPHDIWIEPEGGGYPVLWWQLSPLPTLPTFSGGMGEPNDPYLISTAEELNSIGHNPRLMESHFVLIAYLDLTDYGFYPIGSPDYPYCGVFDGNGHTISHLTIEGKDYLGLFGCLGDRAEVKRLGVEDVNITGLDSCIGGLAGEANGSVTNCYSTGSVSGGDAVGGLVGVNRGSITNSHSIATVSGNFSAGGFAGTNSWSGSIALSHSTGTVSGDNVVGGLVGENDGRITTCYSTSAVSGDESVGGLVGYSGWDGSIINCYSIGKASGNRDIGGLVGREDSPNVQNSVWDEETSGLSVSTGGLGLTTSEMMDSYILGLNGFANDPNWVLDAGRDYPRLAWEGTVGNIIPEPEIGWMEGDGTAESPYQIDTVDQFMFLIEKSSSLWDRCFLLMTDIDLDPNLPNMRVFTKAPIPVFSSFFDGKGHHISNLTIVGEGYLGLFGELGSQAMISNLALEAVDVNGISNRIGGLVGINHGNIDNCYCIGTVSGTGNSVSHVGGLVGWNEEGSITMSYSTGTVRGDNSVGGLVGSNGGSVTTSYSTGTVSGKTRVGGLMGHNYGSITASYSTGTISGIVTISGTGWAVGGLVGQNHRDGSITTSYSTGSVSGNDRVGGLTGKNSGTITTSFWDIQTSGQTNMCGSSKWESATGCDDSFGKTTAEMQTASTFLEAGWDFVDETANGTEDIWWIDEGNDYPRLWWELIPEN